MSKVYFNLSHDEEDDFILEIQGVTNVFVTLDGKTIPEVMRKMADTIEEFPELVPTDAVPEYSDQEKP